MVGVGPRLDRGKCDLLPHKWVSCGVSPTQAGPDALGTGSIWVLKHLWLRCWREGDVVLIPLEPSLIQVPRYRAVCYMWVLKG